jgi:hypothetical protein
VPRQFVLVFSLAEKVIDSTMPNPRCFKSAISSVALVGEFLLSEDYAQIRKTADMLSGLLGDDAKVKRGEQI